MPSPTRLASTTLTPTPHGDREQLEDAESHVVLVSVANSRWQEVGVVASAADRLQRRKSPIAARMITTMSTPDRWRSRRTSGRRAVLGLLRRGCFRRAR